MRRMLKGLLVLAAIAVLVGIIFRIELARWFLNTDPSAGPTLKRPDEMPPVIEAPTWRPEEGVFEGVYHRDRWGVGRIGGTMASQELLEDLAPYEGKPVRIGYGKPVHTWNQHVDMFCELQGATPLPRALFSVSARVRAGRLTAYRPFDVVVELVNSGTAPVRVRQFLVELRARYPRVKRDPLSAQLNPFAPYDVNQLSMSVKVNRLSLTPLQPIDAPIAKSGDLRTAYSFEVGSNGRFPLSLEFPDGLPAEEYELGIWVASLEETPIARDQWTLPATWIPIDVEPAEDAAPTRPSAGFRVMEQRLSRDLNRNYLLEVRLVRDSDGPVRMVAQPGLGNQLRPAGNIRAFDSNGRPLVIYTSASLTHTPRSLEPWRLEPLLDGGFLVAALFTRDNEDVPIQEMQLDLVSDRGLERLVLEDMPACFRSVKFVQAED